MMSKHMALAKSLDNNIFQPTMKSIHTNSRRMGVNGSEQITLNSCLVYMNHILIGCSSFAMDQATCKSSLHQDLFEQPDNIKCPLRTHFEIVIGELDLDNIKAAQLIKQNGGDLDEPLAPVPIGNTEHYLLYGKCMKSTHDQVDAILARICFEYFQFFSQHIQQGKLRCRRCLVDLIHKLQEVELTSAEIMAKQCRGCNLEV